MSQHDATSRSVSDAKSRLLEWGQAAEADELRLRSNVTSSIKIWGIAAAVLAGATTVLGMGRGGADTAGTAAQRSGRRPIVARAARAAAKAGAIVGPLILRRVISRLGR